MTARQLTVDTGSVKIITRTPMSLKTARYYRNKQFFLQVWAESIFIDLVISQRQTIPMLAYLH